MVKTLYGYRHKTTAEQVPRDGSVPYQTKGTATSALYRMLRWSAWAKSRPTGVSRYSRDFKAAVEAEAAENWVLVTFKIVDADYLASLEAFANDHGMLD